MIKHSPLTLVNAPNLEQARTCNEVAAALFPQAPGPAFLEYDVSGLNEPRKLHLIDLNDDFWALTLNHTVFVQAENQFRQYQPSGLYEPITESALTGQILTNLNLAAKHFPASLKTDSFLALKTRARLKRVVERARDLLNVDSWYFKNEKHFLNLANGIFNLGNNTFIEFSPQHPICDKWEVKYDPEAKCDLFLKMFLSNILEPADIDLLQRYLSQVLDGINHSQTILVLTGDAGWGKSSLMKILGTLVGWKNVGIIREQLFRDEFELAHYADKHFLFHPDMPTDFLDRKEASIFKQLVGGDPLWADVKGDDGRMTLQGHYPVILACNGKPKIHLDQDTDAWLRRLVVLSLKTPEHEQHYGKLAELILKTESPGILNWLLEGRAKLAKEKLQLTQTPEQKERAATLLLLSESPAAYVRCCIQKQKGSVIWMAELYEDYQKWCRKHSVSPSRSVDFMRMAKGAIETTFGLSPRHDLIGEHGRARRGWAGLVVVETEEVENQSSLSE